MTWCEELSHLKRPWCWERLLAGGEGNNRWWDGCMASLTPWTWVYVTSGSWWWTGRPGVLQSMGLQRVRHDWGTELNWWFFCLKPFLCLNQGPLSSVWLIFLFESTMVWSIPASFKTGQYKIRNTFFICVCPFWEFNFELQSQQIFCWEWSANYYYF